MENNFVVVLFYSPEQCYHSSLSLETPVAVLPDEMIQDKIQGYVL